MIYVVFKQPLKLLHSIKTYLDLTGSWNKRCLRHSRIQLNTGHVMSRNVWKIGLC